MNFKLDRKIKNSSLSIYNNTEIDKVLSTKSKNIIFTPSLKTTKNLYTHCVKHLIFFSLRLCHLHKFNFANFFHGNFSPGSFLRFGEISECPKTLLLLILYFFSKYLNNFMSE